MPSTLLANVRRNAAAICEFDRLRSADGTRDRRMLVELAQARRATAKYHDVDRAMDDDYVDINVVVPGQGSHYLKFAALLDGTFDPTEPEILVYAPQGNRMKLVAVEYAVPVAASAAPPEGFSGDADHWHEQDGLWLLHAWIWLGNPDGIFADANPKIP